MMKETEIKNKGRDVIELKSNKKLDPDEQQKEYNIFTSGLDSVFLGSK
jgi:hypothetical protein